MRSRKKYSTALLLLFVVCFFMTTPFFPVTAGEAITDVRIRRAVAASIDRAEICAIVFDNYNEPLYSMVPATFGTSHIEAFEDNSTAFVAGNMTAAGYSKTNPYEMDLWYTPSHYGSTEADVAQLLASQLEETGYFDVTLEAAEWGTYLDQLGEMEFFLLGWWFDYPDPSNYIDPFVGAGAIGMGTNYNSTAMNGYIDTMLTDPIEANRTKAQKSAQTLIAEDVPCIPLFNMLSQFIAFQDGVLGVVLEPSENVHYNSMYNGRVADIITIGTSDKVTKLDPADCYDYFSSNVLVQLTHGLMEMPVDSTDAVKGPITSWYNVSTDGMVYNFNLKSGIKFSDGTDCNATAMKWNLDRSIALDGDPGFLLSDVISSVDAVNNTLVKITLSKKDGTFLQRLVYTVAWPVSMSGNIVAGTISGDPTHIPAGVGPYKITTWTKDTEMILEPNTYYFGTAATTDKVIIEFYAGASALLLALENDVIDVAHRKFGPEERKTIIDRDDLKQLEKDTAGIRYLLFKVAELPEEPTPGTTTTAETSETEADTSETSEDGAPGFGFLPGIAAIFSAGAIYVTIKRKRSI